MATQQALVDMGFSTSNIEKAIEACGDNLEQAMEWLLAHADDAFFNATSSESSSTTKNKETEKINSAEEDTEERGVKSIKCDECEKLFKSNEEVEFHAVKSGHKSFSESTEEKKNLSEDEKKEKLKELEERMRQRRKEKEEDERKEAFEREKKRIQMSRDIAETKKRLADQEIKRLFDERRKEKMDDKLARERVKDQIARDKEARKKMFQSNEPSIHSTPSVPASSSANLVQQPAQKKEYDSTRLQIRLPSGPALVQEFKAKEALSAVRLWIKLNRTDRESDESFLLSTTFPRKIFSEEDMDKPLTILGLVPSAVLVITDK